ncbi:MAG: hypothetical protein AAFW00_18945 [Bacteroidota bacterium]
MQNPFQELLPEEENNQELVGKEVMGSLHTRSLLVNMLELFTTVFGVTLRESISPQSKLTSLDDAPEQSE